MSPVSIDLPAAPLSLAFPIATTADDDTKLALLEKARTNLWRYFHVDFSLWNGETGNLLYRGANQPPGDESLLAALVPTLAKAREPQFVGYEDCVVMLAIPLPLNAHAVHVALAAFATRQPPAQKAVLAAARLLGLGRRETLSWLHRQPVWTPESLLMLGAAVRDRLLADCESVQRDRELEHFSSDLSTTYEHIGLLYDLIEHLRASRSVGDLGQIALGWLRAYLPAESVALQYLPLTTTDEPGQLQPVTRSDWLADTNCPLDSENFGELLQSLGLTATRGAFVASSRHTSRPEWRWTSVRQAVIAPLCEGRNLFGWLAAFNHREGGEFGALEASLLRSVGLILGIHCGNRELYRHHSEFLAGVVRSLTSAIDAKDPYTSGHSERVARVSVRLAQELGWQAEGLNTIYLAGLLHDIGKIGIKEHVLCKAGRLDAIEYAHIKKHPELGYRILAGLKQVSEVLPAVLHHHEQWDGGGYPSGLAGEAVPEIARVLAVADAYDAMTSNRPYRQGLPATEVRRVFGAGNGSQWDPRIIAAYFRAEQDICRLCYEERAKPLFTAQARGTS